MDLFQELDSINSRAEEQEFINDDRHFDEVLTNKRRIKMTFTCIECGFPYDSNADERVCSNCMEKQSPADELDHGLRKIGLTTKQRTAAFALFNEFYKKHGAQ